MGDSSNSNLREKYQEFIKEYGYALCRLISAVVEQPFHVSSSAKQFFDEYIEMANSIYGRDNAEEDFKEANRKHLKPYIDLYNAVTQAIDMTGTTLAENHHSSVYQDLYPLMLTESYGAFQKDVAGANYLDERGVRQPLRDLMPVTRKFSEVRQTAMNKTLDFIERNSQTQDIDYQFDDPQNLALVDDILQVAERCRDKEKVASEEELETAGRKFTGNEARTLALKLYRSALWRFTESAFDDAISDQLDALEISTAYRTHWNKTSLKFNAHIENGFLTVRYEKDGDRYLSEVALMINGRQIDKHKPSGDKDKGKFRIELPFLTNYYRIEQIEKIEVVGHRDFNNRHLMNEAGKLLGGGGWLSSDTRPSNWNVSLKTIQLGVTLFQSLHALEAISYRHYEKLAPMITDKPRRKRRRTKRPAGRDYESLWILAAFLMLIDSTDKLFVVQEKPDKDATKKKAGK